MENLKDKPWHQVHSERFGLMRRQIAGDYVELAAGWLRRQEPIEKADELCTRWTSALRAAITSVTTH